MCCQIGEDVFFVCLPFISLSICAVIREMTWNNPIQILDIVLLGMDFRPLNNFSFTKIWSVMPDIWTRKQKEYLDMNQSLELHYSRTWWRLSVPQILKKIWLEVAEELKKQTGQASVFERKPCIWETTTWAKNIPLCNDSLSFIQLLLKHWLVCFWYKIILNT